MTTQRVQNLEHHAVRELDQLASQFRRVLRDCAMQSASRDPRTETLSPSDIHDAVPAACQVLLNDLQDSESLQSDEFEHRAA